MRKAKNNGVINPKEYTRLAAVGTNSKLKSGCPANNLEKLPTAPTINTSDVSIQKGPYKSGDVVILVKKLPFKGIKPCLSLLNTMSWSTSKYGW